MDAVLQKALAIGADRVINVASEADALSAYSANKGYFDVQFEASGNERAVRSGLEALKPRSTVVRLGLGGDVSIPQNMVVAKEIEMKGTFRFHEEFGLAVDFINQRRVDLKPLLTGTFPLEEAVAAFEAAGDRSRSMKVQLAFNGCRHLISKRPQDDSDCGRLYVVERSFGPWPDKALFRTWLPHWLPGCSSTHLKPWAS